MDKKEVLPDKQIQVNGSQFNWISEEGVFSFEGSDAVLFWINTAMKTFFDSIEEISGEEAASLVLETAGFRQGLVVGQFFNSLNQEPNEVLSLIDPIYASAGWGKFTLEDLDIEHKKAVFHIKNSWEYKINKAQGKKKTGSFLPGHIAGVLSGVFGTDVWYKVTKSEILGDEFDRFEYFPSEVTISQNIHALARRKESEEIEKLEKLVAERTEDLSQLVKEISSPIIPVMENIVVVPLLGKYDENRSEELLDKTLTQLPNYQAKYLILDLTGINKKMDEYTVHFIHKLTTSARLLGTETILVGISPELSIIMTQANFNLSGINCFTNLQHGIYYALAQEGRRII